MKVKKILNAVLGHHMMRHRQHKRMFNNAISHVRQFGPGKGLLLLGAVAVAGGIMQARRMAAQNNAQLPEVGSNPTY